jgi:hypothetical protein
MTQRKVQAQTAAAAAAVSRPRAAWWALLVCVGAAGFAAAGPRPAPAQEPQQQVTFEFGGGPQAWTVPPGVVRATFDLYGAEGAGGRSTGHPGGAGGLGAHVTAELAVVPGETLGVMVGGPGSDSAGGFNGGGEPGFFGTPGGGGGGASDIRREGERLLVAAGGGGGAGAGLESAGGDGGASGGTGANGDGPESGFGGEPGFENAPGDGGAGGAGGSTGGTGGLGTGGDGGGVNSEFAGDGGGAGGGYYGGGGGGSGGNMAGGGGGGGGSSYIDPAASGSITEGARSGDGRIVITFTPAPLNLSAKVDSRTYNPRADRRITLDAGCGPVACELAARGKIRLAGRRKPARLRPVRAHSGAGQDARIQLRISRSLNRAIRKALRRKPNKRPRFNLIVEAAAGTQTATRRFQVRVQRGRG